MWRPTRWPRTRSSGRPLGLTGLAADADATDNVTYSLSDDAGGRFAIDANTGLVTVNGALDYEQNGHQPQRDRVSHQ